MKTAKSEQPLPVPDRIIQAKTAKARQPSPVPDRSLSFRPASTTPHPSSQIEVRIPRVEPDPASLPRRRRQILAALEKSTDFKEHLDEIGNEKLFGLNGFSKVFNNSDDEKQFKRLAGRRARLIKRKKVTLDLGLQHLSIHDQRGRERLDLVHPKDQATPIFRRCFDKHESPSQRPQPSLTFSNTVNDNQLGGKFQFVSDYLFRDGVTLAPAHTNHGCDCNGACRPDTCQCLTKAFDDPNSDKKKSDKDKDTKIICQTETYDHSAVVGKSRLTDVYIQRHLRDDLRKTEITECNDRCGCGPDCWNRVVQKGRTLPLEIFQTTKNKGFGVRCPTSAIGKGQFIERYLGEVITATEEENRSQAKDDHDASYIYSLDWFNETNLNNYAYLQVDGEFFGSAMRFVNHSCDPNTRSFPVQTRHQGDRRVYDLAFFAIRDIKLGEEITIDYNPQFSQEIPGDEDEELITNAIGRPAEDDIDDAATDASVDRDSKDEQPRQDKRGGEVLEEGTVLCRCGAKNCRRRLWPPSSARKKRARRVNRW